MHHDENLTAEDYRALAEVRYRIRRFLHFSEQAARAAGLEPQQHQLLLALKGFPPETPVTIGDLAERLLLQHHSTVELVDRLVRLGLLARQRDDTDRRRVLIGLTSDGETALRELSLHHHAELRTAGPLLMLALQRLLTPGADAVPRDHPPPAPDGAPGTGGLSDGGAGRE